MIKRITVTGEESNKYFIHNNGLAKEWEKFAYEHKGEIIGQVNGQMLEFNLKIEIDKIKVHVYMIRQLSNKFAGSLYNDGLLMTKNTIIEIFPVKNTSGDWKIFKANKIAKIWSKLATFSKPHTYDPNFLVVTKQRVDHSNLINLQEFNFLKEVAELRQIVKKGSTLKIEFHNALGTDATINVIKSLIKTHKDL